MASAADAEESATTELHRVLEIEQLESDLFRGTVTPTALASLATIYGGHLVGQGLAAAARTVPARRRPHSMQTYFLRAGQPGEEIEYRVRRTRDGATLSTRSVDIYQRGQQIAQISASFAEHLDGVDHQTPMPEAPEPETIPPLAELVRSDPDAWPPLYQAWTLFDMRYAVAPHDRQARPGCTPPGHAQVWLRATQPAAGDATWHACALAYVSDLTLLSATLSVQSLRPGMPGLAMASLDHVLWFHRACSVSDWLLYDQFVPSTSGGLSLAGGRLFSRTGTLVASVMQEGMVRMIDPVSTRATPAPLARGSADPAESRGRQGPVKHAAAATRSTSASRPALVSLLRSAPAHGWPRAARSSQSFPWSRLWPESGRSEEHG